MLDQQNTSYPNVIISAKPSSQKVWAPSSLSAFFFSFKNNATIQGKNSNSENNHAKNIQAKDLQEYFNSFVTY